jgi:hypothetical protein
MPFQKQDLSPSDSIQTDSAGAFLSAIAAAACSWPPHLPLVSTTKTVQLYIHSPRVSRAQSSISSYAQEQR